MSQFLGTKINERPDEILDVGKWLITEFGG